MQHLQQREPLPDQFVRLTHDVPELGLSRGDVGVVCSTWFSPATAYEVEFGGVGTREMTRALLFRHQIEATSQSAAGGSGGGALPAAAWAIDQLSR